MFLICHVISCKRMLKWLYGWKPFMASHHFAISGGHWPSASGYMQYLICHVTSQNHVIEG